MLKILTLSLLRERGGEIRVVFNTSYCGDLPVSWCRAWGGGRAREVWEGWVAASETGFVCHHTTCPKKERIELWDWIVNPGIRVLIITAVFKGGGGVILENILCESSKCCMTVKCLTYLPHPHFYLGSLAAMLVSDGEIMYGNKMGIKTAKGQPHCGCTSTVTNSSYWQSPFSWVGWLHHTGTSSSIHTSGSRTGSLFFFFFPAYK